MHMTDSMLAYREEFRVLCWADTISMQRNIFIYKGKVILVFTYNKAVTVSIRDPLTLTGIKPVLLEGVQPRFLS
jgi:hypothetical protein